MADIDEENDARSNIFNMSNPRGYDFIKFAENEVLSSYNEILSRLNSLRDKPATHDQFEILFLMKNNYFLKTLLLNTLRVGY